MWNYGMVISQHGTMNQKTALIKCNMNDILHPIPNKWTSAFLAAFSKWLIDLGKISIPSTFPFVNFLKMNMSQQPIDELITQILEKGNINPSRHLISILKTMKQKIHQIKKSQCHYSHLRNLSQNR